MAISVLFSSLGLIPERNLCSFWIFSFVYSRITEKSKLFNCLKLVKGSRMLRKLLPITVRPLLSHICIDPIYLIVGRISHICEKRVVGEWPVARRVCCIFIETHSRKGRDFRDFTWFLWYKNNCKQRSNWYRHTSTYPVYRPVLGPKKLIWAVHFV